MTVSRPEPPEAPVIQILSDAEYRTALVRIRDLESATSGSAEELERMTFERAIAAYLERKGSEQEPSDREPRVAS